MKLTLTIEQAVVEKAKKYAKDKEYSLSSLIENYLKALTQESDPTEVTLTPIVKSLKGSFTAPKNNEYKKALTNRLAEKYT